MNPIIQHRGGFKINDTLASNLTFSGVIRVWEVSKITKCTVDGDFDYWSIRDEYGARMTCYDERLSGSLLCGERYEVKGEVKIGKGGTYLNLKKAVVMSGKEFKEG